MRRLLCGSPLHRFKLRPADFRFARMFALGGMVPFLLLILSSLPDRAQQPLQAKGVQAAKQEQKEQKKGQNKEQNSGHALFLKNCSPCHGAKAQGGEGPNLHGLKLSSPQISATIKNGIKGEMPAFGNKFKAPDIKRLVIYLQSLTK